MTEDNIVFWLIFWVLCFITGLIAAWAASVTKAGDDNPDAVALIQTADRLDQLERELAEAKQTIIEAAEDAADTEQALAEAQRPSLGAWDDDAISAMAGAAIQSFPKIGYMEKAVKIVKAVCKAQDELQFSDTKYSIKTPGNDLKGIKTPVSPLAAPDAQQRLWCEAIIQTQDGSSGRMVCDVERLLRYVNERKAPVSHTAPYTAAQCQADYEAGLEQVSTPAAKTETTCAFTGHPCGPSEYCNFPTCQPDAPKAPSATAAQWIEEELKDGDRLCEAAGVQRTEGGRLPVPKLLHALKDAKRYAARRRTIYGTRMRLQVSGERISLMDFVKEYDAACDKEIGATDDSDKEKK